MKLLRTPLIGLTLAGALALGGCAEDDAVPIAPVLPEFGPEIFESYVSLGNSLTAGFQSAGIVDSTQNSAYPVLVARQAGAEFTVPTLAQPGCPPPLRAPFSGQRISEVPCALRAGLTPRPIQNVAVPGAKIVDAFANLLPESSANALTTFILGGRTQVEAMMDADPTLVSAWLGNNDALGAALTGDVDQLTPLPEFEGSLQTLAGAIEQTRAAANDAVVLIGATDPNLAPALQPGAFFFAVAPVLRQQFGVGVSPNCSPLVPANEQGTAFVFNPLSLNQVSFTLFASSLVREPGFTISCAPDAPFVLGAAESAAVSQRVAAFNQRIAATADANGWLFLNPNAVLLPFLAEQNQLQAFNRIRKCQALSSLLGQLRSRVQATGPIPAEEVPAIQRQIQQFLVVSCPVPASPAVPPQFVAPNVFGSMISFDGVHPSDETHRVLANALIGLLNQRFDLAVPTLDIAPIQ